MGGRAEDAVTPRWRTASYAALAAITGIAAWLRLERLGAPSYWLDEILGQIVMREAAAKPPWRWLAGFHPQHGPLYYAAQWLMARFGESEAIGRSFAALCGIVTVVLVWLLAREAIGGRVAPLAAALLLAVSPLHVYYSREARPYALLMLLTTALLLTIIRGAWRGAIVILIALLYTSVAATPIVAAAAASALLFVWLDRGVILSREDDEGPSPLPRRERRSFADAQDDTAPDAQDDTGPDAQDDTGPDAQDDTGRDVHDDTGRDAQDDTRLDARNDTARARLIVAIAALVTLPLFALLYRGAAANDSEAAFPGLSAAFFDQLVRGLAVTTLGSPARGRTAYLLLVFVVIGAIALARRNRAMFATIAGMAVLPIAINVAALEASNHFFAIRYVTAALPAYLVLAAAGMSAIAKRVPAAALVMAALVAWQCWPVARSEAFRKLDWRTIGTTIAHYAHDDDLVITAEPWSDVCLRYYLKRPLRVGQVSEPLLADLNTTLGKGKWIVTAGPFGDTPIRRWMCRYPMVLAGPYEEFRMHYAGDFVRERGTLAEQHALAGAMGRRARMLPDEFNGEGWANVEGTYRWATSQRASLTLPRFGARDRVIRVWVLPYRPPQNVRVFVNGALAGSFAPPGAWTEQRVAVPARFWRDGTNEIEFVFDHAIAPASAEKDSRDERTLAACFEWISIDDAGAPAIDPPRVRPVRIASVCLSCPAGETNPRLLARLGLDPTLHADAASSIAWGTACEEPRAWLRRVFAVLLDREPSPIEERDLLAVSRDVAVRRITRGSEFRKRW